MRDLHDCKVQCSVPAMLGNYELLQSLGRGGMAEVHRARRRGPAGVEKHLVIKRIRRENTSDPRFVQLFIAEAKLSMSFTHRNIVSVFDFGRSGDELFLVMEYVDGPDLDAALRGAEAKAHCLPPLLVAYIANETCQALSYAHRTRNDSGVSRAIVHRDVTPKNVLLSRNGEVKLADFGVAITDFHDQTTRAKTRGTPGYMAPEQARGEAVDQRADVFAVGLIMWEAIQGRPARTGKTAEQLLTSARSQPVPLVDETVPEVLRDIVRRATAMEPAARFSDAQDMQFALDRFIVTARAANAEDESQRRPPAHQLAAWLADVVPACHITKLPESEMVSPGHAVTYLEDGPDALVEPDVNQTRMRSQAVTVIDATDDGIELTGEESSSTEEATVTAEPTDNRSASRVVPLLLATATIVGLVGLITWKLIPGGSSKTTVPISVGEVPTRAAHSTAPAVLPVDAGVSARDATEINSSQQDATINATRRPSRSNKSKPQIKNLQPGTLEIGSNPWATVRVRNDVGKQWSCPETPCTLQLPPGSYMLRLNNPVKHLSKERRVRITTGKRTQVRETLTRSSD